MSKIFPEKKRLSNDRIDFSEISGNLELPYLCEIQTKSYQWFKETGIKDVFNEVFPIMSYQRDMRIDFVDLAFNEPKYSFLECKARNLTFNYPLFVTLRLSIKDTGEIKEHSVYMGDRKSVV